MRNGLSGLLLFALVVADGQAHESSAPLSAYGKLPFLENLSLSPDGKRLAFVRTSGDERTIFVMEIGAKSADGALPVGHIKLRQVLWQDNDTVLAMASSTKPAGYYADAHEVFQAVRYSVSDRQVRNLDFGIPDMVTFNVVGGRMVVREVAGKPELFVPGYSSIERIVRPTLFRFESSGHARIIERVHDTIITWIVDGQGQLAAEMAYDDQTQTWNLRARHQERMERVASGKAAIDVPELLGLSDDGAAAILEVFENGEGHWIPVSLKDGSKGAPLAGGQPLHGLIPDARSARILGGFKGAEESEYEFFDNELQAHWNAVLRAFPGESVRLVSASDDFSRLILRVFGPKSGYSYALFDWYSHAASPIGPVYDNVKKVAEVRRISYQAKDGLEIPAILTLPEGEPKNRALVLLPHGGPASLDIADFNWWAQALADQGYVVLQPNYRGSTLSARFLEAGYGEWGRKMQTDLSDGVAYLAREGMIDPARVCIVGASYGGYAALAGETLQPELYRCAISIAGISDLGSMRKWIHMHRADISTRYWDRFLGLADRDDKAAKDISPIEHIAEARAPLLLIHGKDDTVVPYEQSTEMERAMKRAGKNVQFVTLNHEDHWLSSSDTRLQMLEATVVFLKTNNPPN